MVADLVYYDPKTVEMLADAKVGRFLRPLPDTRLLVVSQRTGIFLAADIERPFRFRATGVGRCLRSRRNLFSNG